MAGGVVPAIAATIDGTWIRIEQLGCVFHEGDEFFFLPDGIKVVFCEQGLQVGKSVLQSLLQALHSPVHISCGSMEPCHEITLLRGVLLRGHSYQAGALGSLHDLRVKAEAFPPLLEAFFKFLLSKYKVPRFMWKEASSFFSVMAFLKYSSAFFLLLVAKYTEPMLL